MRPIRNVTYDYRGEVVLVTGAARGQGRSHALGFAAAGADVVICDIGESLASVPYPLGTSEQLNAVAEEVRALGVRCQPAICDIRSRAQVQTMVDDAIAEFGRIDILINNAGIESIASVADMSEETWDDMIDIQLKGTFLCSKLVSEHMVAVRKGRIINTASTSSLIAAPRQAHYVTAKTGMYGFTKALAIELAPYDITVNSVCPGGVDTPMIEGLLASPHAEWLQTLVDLSGPSNLFGEGLMLAPEEITNAMLWLASDAASYVTGHGLVVDGGYTIK